MSSNSSVLWNDSTLAQDEALVRVLVENIVAGKNVKGHYDDCTKKIMNKIQTAKWQAAFPHRTHIFSVFYGITIKSVVEIKLSLHAQALELLYFNIASTSHAIKLDPEAGFHIKLQVVFEETYKWKMPLDTAHAIRILRNDVMHTGTIAGVTGAYRNKDDPKRLERFFNFFDFNKNQLKTDVQNRIQLAHIFDMLVQDMLIRTLGLDQSDLNFNGLQVWNSNVFGYDHENRPQWLRNQ